LVDKRLHARVPIDATLVCEQPSGPSFAAQAKDISVGGMYLDAGEQPAFGTEVTLVGHLPGAKKEVRLPAVVRWTKPGGFGVQFGLLGALETHVISELMKGH
jgi:PilZ domain